MKAIRTLSNISILLGLCLTHGIAGVNDGLVAYYPLNGDVRDASGHGYHGVNTGVTFQPGHDGQGAFFDGDSAKHVRVDGFPEIRSNLTIAAWFKPQSLPAPGQPGSPLVTRGYLWQEAYTLFVDYDFIHAILNWESPERLDPNVAIPHLSEEIFHHAALVYDFDAGRVYIYLDGERQGVFEYSSPLYEQTEPLYFGVSFPGGLEVFRGILDDVRIYNRPLSEGEIMELFTSGAHLTLDISEVRLCWSSCASQTYQLQYRSDLTASAWSNFGGPIQGNNTTNYVTDAVIGRERRFYRVTLVGQ